MMLCRQDVPEVFPLHSPCCCIATFLACLAKLRRRYTHKQQKLLQNADLLQAGYSVKFLYLPLVDLSEWSKVIYPYMQPGLAIISCSNWFRLLIGYDRYRIWIHSKYILMDRMTASSCIELRAKEKELLIRRFCFIKLACCEAYSAKCHKQRNVAPRRT